MDVAQIEWMYLNDEAAAPRVGELISAEAGGMPIYRVMSVDTDRAWLQDVDTGQDRLAPLQPFHWRAATL